MNRSRIAFLLAAGLVGSTAVAATADVEPPILHAEQLRGSAVVTALPDEAPTPKVVDGRTDDWTGAAPDFSGFSAYSRGELVYTDYLFDSFGADDGDDAERVARNDALAEQHPGFYRLEPTYQYDIGGEFGAPTQELGLGGERQYGDARDADGRGHVAAADLRELRIAADDATVHLLARTTTMTEDAAAALVLVADTVTGDTERVVPFGSGLTTRTGDVALLIARSGGIAVDLASGRRTEFPVDADAEGHANVLEAAIPRELVERAAKKSDDQSRGRGKGLDKDRTGRGSTLRLMAATGVSDGRGGLLDLTSDKDDVVDVANVAFRPQEPVRIRFDKQQAFALAAGTIDGFVQEVDLDGLTAGRTEAFRPGPGYHERHFTSDEAISVEGDLDGTTQPYGAYVPTTYDPAKKTRTTYWMHFRGGDTHDSAVVSPRIMRDFGEDVGGLVVAPRGRGTSTWYVGRGQVDFREVWDDALRTFSIDEDRVYVTGHSMGGWASYLLPILYPDRFAASLPYAGVPTQGLYAGCDLDPCYQPTNGGDAKVQHTKPLLENLRNVPVAISHGVLDELVPVTGVTRQAEQLHRLGYQYRYYLFPTYEHYSHPVHDEWTEGASYASQFVRNPNPERVTYLRSMPFERTVETGPNQGDKTPGLSFDFDRAYWMSGLTPQDDQDGVAKVDARSLATPSAPVLAVPEAGGPASVGQFGPWTMNGQRWVENPTASAPERVNGFTATLSGAKAVTFDLPRMSISTRKQVAGTVTSEVPLTLSLIGDWAALPSVTVNDGVVTPTLQDGVLQVHLPSGTSTLTIG